MVSFCHQAISTPPSLHSIQCVQFIIANQDVLLVVQLEYSRHLFSVPSSPILDLLHYTCVIAAACYSSSLLFSFFVAAMGGGSAHRVGHDWKVVHKGGGKGGGKGEGKLKGRGVAPQGVAPHGPVSAGAAPFEVGDDFGSLPHACIRKSLQGSFSASRAAFSEMPLRCFSLPSGRGKITFVYASSSGSSSASVSGSLTCRGRKETAGGDER